MHIAVLPDERAEVDPSGPVLTDESAELDNASFLSHFPSASEASFQIADAARRWSWAART